MGTLVVPTQPRQQQRAYPSYIFIEAMYVWLLLCCLSVLRAFPTYLADQDDSPQLNSEEGEDSLFNLVSELESLDQMDKRAPYNFGVGKRSPYNFGVGKRELWQDGWRKRMPYNFGVGR